jgi:hypothetical protein
VDPIPRDPWAAWAVDPIPRDQSAGSAVRSIPRDLSVGSGLDAATAWDCCASHLAGLSRSHPCSQPVCSGIEPGNGLKKSAQLPAR